ncbi:MAG: EAL domain-containing protein [Pygmaiobacter massiliensis]|nr:EAL domain-containing protein [Pygmaiobacter massiliensis]
MEYACEKPLNIAPENWKGILNQFCRSTGDVYYLYDLERQRIFFSENILTAGDLLAVKETECTIEQWQQVVDCRDLHRVMRLLGEVESGRRERYNFNYRVRNRQGQTGWVNSRGHVMQDTASGEAAWVLGRLSAESLAKPKALLANRELKKELRRILDKLQPGHLLLIGVDDLKRINMKNGRYFGDAVLDDVAQVITDELPAGCVLYRMNGDWFAVNLPGADKAAVKGMFERVQARISGQCTVSAGCVSFLEYRAPDEHILLQYAETALEYSKTHGKNQLTFFSPEHYEKKLRELELREELQASVQADFAGFEVYYQAQVYAKTYTLYGAEALLRYRSSRLGNISPLEFVPILEQSGLIYPVGLWVLRQALKSCVQWQRQLPQFRISVNMAYAQLEQDTIEEDVLELLRESKVSGSALTIEVTESRELSNYPQLNRIFRRWKKHGIQISVDDFGTGYSSLGRLKELEIDEIKIDRCFVREIQNSAYNYRLLSNIIELADASQIRVCCEGVETEQELCVLDDLHPTLLQGFYFAKPKSAEEFEACFLLENWLPPRLASRPSAALNSAPAAPSAESCANTILNAENDIFYLCDLESYELYYVNPAGQKMFGVKDYLGRKCYKVFWGRDTPCPFCPTQFLREDSFYIWESHNPYCDRHFLLKDKIVPYQGKNVRLEIALDITKQEYISQAANERLAFADKIVEYMDALAAYPDYRQAANQALASVCDFYQADRSHLFQRNPKQPDHWDCALEWCACNVTPQQDFLQQITPAALARWMKLFERGESIFILNTDALRKVSPLEWELLARQDIERLIAVPIRDGKDIIGFIGVDNPRYCIHDDSQMRFLASFLLARIRQEHSERRYQLLLQSSNQDLMRALNVGLWTLEISKKDHSGFLETDETMRHLLQIPATFSGRQAYEFWQSHIQTASLAALRQAFERMRQEKQVVQVEYNWLHSTKGSILLRFSGILLEDTPACIRFKGYCRQLLAPGD